MNHRNCLVCGRELKGMPDAKTLRSLGYCQACLPDKHRCQGITNSGKICKRLVTEEGLCRQHRQAEIARARREAKAGPVVEGKCQAIIRKGRRCKNKAVDGDFCRVHSKEAKAKRRREKKIAKRNKPSDWITRPDYREYLKSERWREKSAEAKRRADWRCQICNKKGNMRTLHSHHRTYKRLGNEKPMDLTVLCPKCHSLYHTSKESAV